MRIIFEHTPLDKIDDAHHKVIMETDATTAYEVLFEVKNLLVAFGYHPDSVNDALDELNEEINGSNEKKE